ncbi:MAG TPA: sigma-70 family RNA polymerase sigma factor [Sedimentisphaerales bacterium]|nr:sigma-70 family RNA polymerase sigma factor [Sedimentisphaerales bacterium]
MLENTSSEVELLRASVKGSATAFEAIVKKYQSLACAITFSATEDLEQSEELAHEAFIKAWVNLSQLEDLTKFRVWLYSITHNVIRDYFRHKQRDIVSQARPIDRMEDISSEEFRPIEIIIDKEQHAVIRQALDRIPEKYREPLVLFYRQEHSMSHVAELLGLSVEAAKTRVSRGRKMLKDQVATMVEATISHTGPGKAFTATVIASLAGLAIEGSGVSTAAGIAATASGGGGAATAASVMSGVTAKIIAAAAAVAIGVGAVVTYRHVTKPSPGPEFSQTGIIARGQREEHSLDEVRQSEAEESFADAATDTGANERHEIVSGKNIGSLSPEHRTGESIGEHSDKPQKPQTGISGIVVNKSSSRPIRRAEVFYGQRKKPEASFLTDANGHFEFLDMEARDQQCFYIIAKGFTSRRITLDIVKDKVYENYKVELTHGSKVAGIIYDQNDRPVKGATVGTFQFTNHPVITDANGTFEIDGLDPGWGSYQLQVTHPNYPALATNFSPANAGETAWKDIVLKPGVTVYGQVTNAEGNPVVNVDVGNTASRRMWNCIETKTDNEGRYELKNVDTGELVLWAISNKYAPYVERFSLDDNKPSKKLINIRLANPVPLHGKIVDKQGNPVPGVTVNIRKYKGLSSLTDWRDRVTSDSEGKFTLRSAPPDGKVIIEVFADFVPNLMRELEIGQEEECIIEIDRAGKIYGRVANDRTDEPIRRFNVKLSFSKNGTKPGGGYAATWNREGHNFDSTEGFFDTGRENIPVGAEYSMTVYANGFDPLTIDPVIVRPTSNDPNRTEFRLKPATAIAGRVVDCNSTPIAGARIRILSNDSDFEHWDDRDTTVTNHKGEFLLSGVGSQERCIYITAETFAPYLGSSLDLSKNSEGMAEITLQSGLEVFGRVIDANGRGIAGAGVSAHAFSEQLRKLVRPPWPNLGKNTYTDMEGYYDLFDLPAGDISVNVNSSTENGNLNLAHKEIKLEQGRSVELNFGDEVGFRLTGTVRMGQTLLEKANVEIHLPDNSMKWGHTDSEGRFQISGIPKGTHTISTSYDSGSNQKTFQREPGQWIYDTRRVAVEGNTELEITLGDSSVSGKIPVQLMQNEQMKIVTARRWAPKESQDGIFLQRWEYVASARVDSDGTFRCANLRAGRHYLLLSSSDGDTLGITDEFELGESEHIDNVAFNTGNGTLQINVIDADTSQGIPDCVFYIRNDLEAMFCSKKLAPEGSRYGMTTDGNGQAEYSTLPDGNYVVWAETPGFLPGESESVKVHGGEITSVTLSLEPAAVVRFELDSVVKERITGEYVYLRCRVTDAETREPVPMLTLYGENAEHTVRLGPEKISIGRQPDLKLHEGTYNIEYRLYQDRKGSLSFNAGPPLLEGTVTVKLNRQETKLVTISP